MQPMPIKRLFFDRIFQRSYWTWRRHPTIIVPTMLASGLTAIEEAVATAPIILYLLFLASNNTLTQFLNEFSNGTGYLGGFSSLLNDPVFSPGFILVIATITIGAILVFIVGGGFVLSAEYGTYVAAWTKSSISLGDVLDNGRKGWKRTSWTLFLTEIVTWGPAVLGFALFLIFAVSLTSTSGFADIFLVIVFGLVAGLLSLVSIVLSIFTLYSIPAAIIDQVSGFTAITRSFHFTASHLRITLTYGIVRIVFQVFTLTLILLGSLIGLPLSSLAMIVLSLLLTPILHSTKAMIYSYGGPSSSEMPFELYDPIWRDISRRLPQAAWRKVRLGLSEIGRFLASPGDLPFHLLAALAFALGIWLGDYVSSNGLVVFLGIQPGTINPSVVNSFGPVLGIDIFANNWLVSIATGLAGLGFGLPSFQTILFNGFIVGVIIPAFQNLTLLLAGILPHGIIEIPSLVISGSSGLKLGWAALKARLSPSPENKEFLSMTLRQTVYIVVGLAPLFLIAGLIEGNVTPIIMRWFGWTG